ncbi:MAG: hypothetical protein JXB13_03115 [Phycisphaerae bacterium]|nr:hypothetical protein [Phycisphaerae bacterium]
MKRCLVLAGALLATVTAGCGGDARVELSAATAIQQLTSGLAVAIEEYHAEVGAADDRREAAVVDAFITRIRADHADPAATDQHAEAFRAALDRVRADRAVEWRRYHRTRDMLETLDEIRDGLQQLAIDSLTLSDELRRYLHDMLTRPTPTGQATPKTEDQP